MKAHKHFVPDKDLRLRYNFRFLVQGVCKGFHSIQHMIGAVIYIVLIVVVTQYLNIEAGVMSAMLTSLYSTTVVFFGIILGLLLLFLYGAPDGYIKIMRNMERIGMVNANGECPVLLQRSKCPDRPNAEEWIFESFGIAFSAWVDYSEEIESALNVAFIKAEEGSDGHKVILTLIPNPGPWPRLIKWDDHKLLPESARLLLGENRSEPISLNLSVTPHVLIAGRTGSGKSVLQKCLMYQCLLKKMTVFLVDYKRGVDYTGGWHDCCEIITDDEPLIRKLDELYLEMIHRLDMLEQTGYPNIDKYNESNRKTIERVCVFFDEIVECIDKTGVTKERKEIIQKIEGRLSSITRLGRAAGIHVFLATQRGSADVLNGQIRNNVFKICGACDENLSILTIGTADAAKKIPSDAIGRFLTENGIMFQGYYADYGPALSKLGAARYGWL